MVFTLTQSPRTQSPNRTATNPLPMDRELVVFCPGCKTLETLWFNNGWLMQTRKFNQQDERVFHDCGTPEPCHLYRSC